MVYRDPDSGKFRSGGGEQRRFRDLEHRHVLSDYQVEAAELPGAFPINATDIQSIDLDDILHRDERADLLMLKVHGVQALVPGTASSENALGCRWEVNLGNGSEMVLAEDRQYDANVDESGTVDRWTSESDNPDILYHAGWTAEGGFNDTVNGTAAGGYAPVLEETVHLHQEYGSCPTLDSRDEITESLYLNQHGSADIADSQVQLTAAYSLVFDVYEDDR